MSEVVMQDHPTSWLEAVMLSVGFFCSSLLINLLAFSSWFPCSIPRSIILCFLFIVIFGKWVVALTWIWSSDTLGEEGKRGDARRRWFEAASLYTGKTIVPKVEQWMLDS